MARWKAGLVLRLRVIAKLGGKCVVPGCGITDPRLLQVNHRDGNGGRDFKRNDIEAARQFYRALVNGTRSTDDLDLRCANHNLLYEYERGARFCDPDIARQILDGWDRGDRPER